ncbi:hypothetical protein ACHAXM_001410 [Skeletonema potamos]
MPAGVPDNFLFIHEASTKFAMLGEAKRMYGEYEYKKLYDDLVANEGEWMEFFAHLANRTHAGDCAMVLQPLTRIYFDRGNHDACGEVLEMHCAFVKSTPIEWGSIGLANFVNGPSTIRTKLGTN